MKRAAFQGFPIRKWLWRLTYPARIYIRRAPSPRGKGFLQRRIVQLALPASPATFEALLGDGNRIELEYRETLGISTLINGEFEKAERSYLASLLTEGSVAIDVGANIGMFSLSLAKAVGLTGKVISFEPVVETAKRLQRNAHLNRCTNITVHVVAVGDREGEIEIIASSDAAYSSTQSISKGNGEIREVPMTTLDTVWKSANLPKIDVIKIDVEGAEAMVARGAVRMLQTCRPVILLEATGRSELSELDALLLPLGFRRSQPKGFRPWNYLYSHGSH
jgi:FkbM family methyltransferase